VGDAGEACCVRSTASTCVARDPAACADPESFYLGCVHPDPNGRECCWNVDGALHATAFSSAGCGTTFGIRAASDSAVPADLVCP
jgi:hypothetical protein